MCDILLIAQVLQCDCRGKPDDLFADLYRICGHTSCQATGGQYDAIRRMKDQTNLETSADIPFDKKDKLHPLRRVKVELRSFIGRYRPSFLNMLLVCSKGQMTRPG